MKIKRENYFQIIMPNCFTWNVHCNKDSKNDQSLLNSIVLPKNTIIKLVSKETLELSQSHIYEYQDSFNFIKDMKDEDLSLWLDAPFEYFRYLNYMDKTKKYDIEVFTRSSNDEYKRNRLIKNAIMLNFI